jgi:hypothetical protein
MTVSAAMPSPLSVREARCMLTTRVMPGVARDLHEEGLGN